MIISKERIEELRDKLLLRLQSDLEEIIHTTIEEVGKDSLKFLFNYIDLLKKDTNGSIGNRSSNSYVYIDFPLSIWDFTKEELIYLNFYSEK